MLAGIGVLILVSQFHVMLDHIAAWHGEKAHGGLQYLATIPEAIMKCFSADTIGQPSFGGVDRNSHDRLHRRVAIDRPQDNLELLPAALIGIVAATLFAAMAGLDIQMLNCFCKHV